MWGGGGDNRGVQEFGVKDYLGVIWSNCSNTLKTILPLHDSTDFDETWVKDPWPEALSGCSGIIDQRSSWGHLGSLFKGQILNSLLQQN